MTADDLATCGCTDRRPARARRCICGSRKPPGRAHTLACQFARADAAHAAHTNAGPSMRRAAMDALTLARGRYTRAVEAAARVVGV